MRRYLRRLLSGLTVLVGAWTAAPGAAVANPDAARAGSSLKARVEAVRSALAAENDAHDESGTRSAVVAQWLNWGNWPNWRNFWRNY